MPPGFIGVVFLSSGAQMDALEEMARKCFGYGHWGAPYWFIGLEEGMSGNLEDRLKTFQRRHVDGLSGCRDFHHDIAVYKHHEQQPPLEPTWRVLMLVLLTYLGRDNSKEARKAYQAKRLGTPGDETALLELFGLPAKDLKAGLAQRQQHFSKQLIRDIHEERVATLRKKLDFHKPELVMMYGVTSRAAFGKLAGRSLKDWEIFWHADTLMTFTPHPTARGMKNEDWITHAKILQHRKKKATERWDPCKYCLHGNVKSVGS
jgi:hypothetical protein